MIIIVWLIVYMPWMTSSRVDDYMSKNQWCELDLVLKSVPHSNTLYCTWNVSFYLHFKWFYNLWSLLLFVQLFMFMWIYVDDEDDRAFASMGMMLFSWEKVSVFHLFKCVGGCWDRCFIVVQVKVGKELQLIE